jgi:hypothetical protein
MGWSPRVLPIDRALVPDVMICGRLELTDSLLAAFSTAMHHDAISRRRPEGRLGYTRPSATPDEMLTYATLIKGRPLDEADRRRIEVIHGRFMNKGEGVRYGRVRESFMAGEALAMDRAVYSARLLPFGKRLDAAKALENFREKLGWAAALAEHDGAPPAVIAKALHKGFTPILVPKDRTGDRQVLVVLGMCEEQGQTCLVCADPARTELYPMTEWDIKAENPRDFIFYTIQPPGSGGWRTTQSGRRVIFNADLIIRSTARLPAGCFVMAYEPGRWSTMVVGDIHPHATPWRLAVEQAILPEGGPGANAPEPDTGDDGARWNERLRARAALPVDADRDLVADLRLCPASGTVSDFAASLATVLVHTHPGGARMLETGAKWPEYAYYIGQSYRRQIDARQLDTIIRNYHFLMDPYETDRRKYRYKPPLPNPIPPELKTFLYEHFDDSAYQNGDLLWGLVDESVQELRGIYAEVAGRNTSGPLVRGKEATLVQQLASQLQELVSETRSIQDFVGRFEDTYGWGAVHESMEKPSFAFIRKAVEMRLPVLARRSDGTWVVIAGYLLADEAPLLLVVDSRHVQPEAATADISEEDHLTLLCLPSQSVARQRHREHLATAVRDGRAVVMDPRLLVARELPSGCRFEPMVDGMYEEAHVVHTWTKSVVGKTRIDLAVARGIKLWFARRQQLIEEGKITQWLGDPPPAEEATGVPGGNVRVE